MVAIASLQWVWRCQVEDDRQLISCSGVDINSEVTERSPKKIKNDLYDDYPKISPFFLSEIQISAGTLNTNRSG